MKPTTERRSFYRINDTIGLHFTLLDDGAVGQPAGALDRPLSSQLDEIDRDFNQLANILWQENPTFARALGLLNRKLSLLAARTLGDESRESTACEELLVNISGSGMGFDSPEQFARGARLLLTLVLKPSNVTLRLTGVVIASEPGSGQGENGYWTRVNFDESDEAAREQLIQHVVQRQCAQIQKTD